MELTTNRNRGYVALGIVVICCAIFFSSFLFFATMFPFSSHFTTSSLPQSLPPDVCTVVTTTITDVNGSHRNFNVTCSGTVHLSELANVPDATLSPAVQSLLSNVTYSISFLSAIATVAVTLMVWSPQGKNHDKLVSRATFSLIATWLMSMTLVLALFLMLAQPLNAIPAFYSNCLLLILPALTLVGFGLSIISWGLPREGSLSPEAAISREATSETAYETKEENVLPNRHKSPAHPRAKKSKVGKRQA
jgi:hypothetical protein